jgi:putative multicomponent Na+:H+ antiporter subunit B
MTDLDLLAIVALLPIAALMTIAQKNPYHALVVRGILGAIAALVYALLGAADVALTEALVGTMLAITLYMVSVRSSLVLQFGVVAEASEVSQSVSSSPSAASPDVVVLPELPELPESSKLPELPELTKLPESLPTSVTLEALLSDLRIFCRQHFLRFDLVTYDDREALYTALENREVHAIGLISSTQPASALSEPPTETIAPSSSPTYTVTVRVQRLYDLMQTELNPAIVALQPTFPIEAIDPPAISTASHP